MPPRRAKKVGNTRMDAAVDALEPMGYSSGFIRRKVKQLLKVYGDEGWKFIEEAAYTLLIETILADGECEEGEASTKNKSKDEPSNAEDEPSNAEESQDPLPLSPITVRKPSFGFIGQEAGEDYVLLKPAPVKGRMPWKTDEKRKKCKSRWDMGPDDIA